jgi:U3 small nucleolar RNA-associated protein 12
MVETWRIRTSDEIKKKLKRHLKKLKEKAAKSGEDQAEMEENISNAINQPLSPSDRITSWGTIRTQHRIRSFSTSFQTKPAQVSVLLGLTNNSVHVQTIALPDSDPKAPFEPQEQYQLELQGHRSEIRSVSLSSDDRLLASFGPGLVKIWDIETLQCIRTLECGHALCGSFLPGDRYVAVGTKAGNLQLFDLGSSTMVQDVKAHNGSIWSLDIRPDENGLVTGGGDKNVMFWDFKELNLENIGRHLQVEHVKTLQMTDDVLCVRYSPNQNLLAVALLDATVKVFYTDSLKLFLSLYGHKLPVMSMDISSDNSLILTGSADKNIKIWGLDFGDCHKSLFAHDEAVVGVRFQPKTHYFFSCGKDHQVRYWDGDRFESIMKLSGHLGEVWGLEISKKGRFVVSASGDRSIRIWVRTDEPLFLEEEREKEMEETYEQELVGNENDGDEDEEGVDRAGKATMESLKAGERIIEAVELCQREWERKAEYDQLVARGQNPPPPMVEPLLNALQVNGEQYLLDTIAKVKSAELEDALLVLPLSHVVHIFKCIQIWCKRRVQIPLICRITTFLTQTHHRQLVSNQLLKPVIDNVKEGLRQNLKQQKVITNLYNIKTLLIILL